MLFRSASSGGRLRSIGAESVSSACRPTLRKVGPTSRPTFYRAQAMLCDRLTGPRYSAASSWRGRSPRYRETEVDSVSRKRPSIVAVGDDRLTSDSRRRLNVSNAQISLKNSNFCVDHSSEDRWQAQWKIPQGFGGGTGFADYDPPI